MLNVMQFRFKIKHKWYVELVKTDIFHCSCNEKKKEKERKHNENEYVQKKEKIVTR